MKVIGFSIEETSAKESSPLQKLINFESTLIRNSSPYLNVRLWKYLDEEQFIFQLFYFESIYTKNSLPYSICENVSAICSYVDIKIWHNLTLSNQYSENSSLNLKFCVALCNATWKSNTKNAENPFFFFLFIIFSSNSRFKLKFCVGLSFAIAKSYVWNEEIFIMKFWFMKIFPTKESRNLWEA